MDDDFLNRFAKPAQRALVSAHIRTVRDVCGYTKSYVRGLHGVGKNAMTIIESELQKHGLEFAPERKSQG